MTNYSVAHPQEGQSQLHWKFQDDLRSPTALTEIPQANMPDGTPVILMESSGKHSEAKLFMVY